MMKVAQPPLVGSFFLPSLGLAALSLIVGYWVTRKKKDNIKSELNINESSSGLANELYSTPTAENPKRKKKKHVCNCGSTQASNFEKQPSRIKIMYGTLMGKSKKFAEILLGHVAEDGVEVSVINLKECDSEDNFVGSEAKDTLFIFIVSTYAEGSPPDDAQWFYKWLEDSAFDFRVPKTLLADVRFSVFGLGNSLYSENYNVIGRNIDNWLSQLGAERYAPLGLGDENVAESFHGNIEADFDHWSEGILNLLKKPQHTTVNKTGCSKGNDCCSKKGKKKVTNSFQKKKNNILEETDVTYDTDSDSDSNEPVLDLEDLGSFVRVENKAVEDSEEEEEMSVENGEAREMLTPQLRESLTKQGYRLIGTHSGVKLCRWTKAMLRGRGGCYKHTFYGIESHRCMETTPSLACANKCVFCWRHHSNPVGTEWRWKMDPAEFILEGALEQHGKMINQFKGVPGVQPDRLVEGMSPVHCALSLVGEPIMYPEINRFLRMLHEKKISSFLVTNAQFPEAIRQLEPCTQLYVSVDASTKESLKKIDRPLFKDFWERFLDSLRALSAKGQRTVYRLTLVKAWNVEELESYANLVKLGEPDFIEIKGVTFCGTSKASTLTMENIPWHHEVVTFGEKICTYLEGYGLAAEHEHSNCILLAKRSKFFRDGRWNTWIDYDKFHQLMREYYLSEGKASFTSEDYMASTPDWAMFGSPEHGFDPLENRWHRKQPKKDISGC
ncbi:S-adenosyl-L-methionine-dependent tRNA 4-demethylwyosine synthase TYW1-like [Daphnia carinata]|uniref:S-adenosyl-L-methionine-dependent tRNA 4-demethylwyosine synthase TYW1-like n=1 Tax=Daphnia carinata TaxID=120202 RepID=UPI002579E492|nr:S-adenosyl-L-methionine-dependent tRNA 4-demethylwyosine synthase TYW1-like [Daphnia carinata]